MTIGPGLFGTEEIREIYEDGDPNESEHRRFRSEEAAPTRMVRPPSETEMRMPSDNTTDAVAEQTAAFNVAWRAAHADGIGPNLRRWLEHMDLPEGSVYELDALGARSEQRDRNRPPPNLIAFTRDRAEVLRLAAEADEKFRAPGVYIVPAVMDAGWIQYDFGPWQWCTKANGRCSDEAILVRRNCRWI